MIDVTRILTASKEGNGVAAEELAVLLYDELRAVLDRIDRRERQGVGVAQYRESASALARHMH
ncbi:MAG: hypothetical protein HOP15_07945 [Planctomycetes bacterium]|nr:hypothetical protein [Planctomycetota bacterium]